MLRTTKQTPSPALVKLARSGRRIFAILLVSILICASTPLLSYSGVSNSGNGAEGNTHSVANSIVNKTAIAETLDIEPIPNELEEQVELTSDAYYAAQTNLRKINAEIAKNESEFAEIEKKMPFAQQRLSEAAKQQYIMSGDGLGFIAFIFGAANFAELITKMDYANFIVTDNVAAIDNLVDLKTQHSILRNELIAQKVEAMSRETAAEIAMSNAIVAREAAYEAAIKKAQDDAAAKTVIGNIEWGAELKVFVNDWEGRINDYLADSPLAGYGATFAQAAWKYGVDPRISPAISTIESGKGANCFYPHNAWGWGTISWPSWEEAIYAHVRGWSQGYGGELDMGDAQRYCGGDSQHWYDSVLSEMNQI